MRAGMGLIRRRFMRGGRICANGSKTRDWPFHLQRRKRPGTRRDHHLSAIERHVPHVPIHNVLVNATPIPASLIEQYAAEGAAPVSLDADLVLASGCQPVERDLLSVGPKIRHDPHKLARAILEIL